MIHLYTLLSHSGICLPYQVTLARRNLPELKNISIVQGPWGDDSKFSAGRTALNVEIAKRERLKIVNAPGTISGLHSFPRLIKLWDFLFSKIVSKQDEQYALILAGDVFPVIKMDTKPLLLDNDIAMRGFGQATMLTWVLLKKGVAYSVSQLDDKNITYWPTKIQRESDHIEWCEPGWLHLDRIAKGLQDSKIKYLKQFTGLDINESWTYEKDNVPEVRLKRLSGVGKVCSWVKAIARWVANGSPKRSDKEVRRLIRICKKCKYYSPKGQCRACGCAISEGAWAITNKARMATENCPKNKWYKQ